jgi:large subunit ribosomal protein L18e
MAKRKAEKSNPQLTLLRETLKASAKASAREQQVGIWKDLARRLDAPSNNFAEVNLSRLNRYTTSGDVVLVPGKVLGAGLLDHPIFIGALAFSEKARSKILAADGNIVTIDEIIQRSPRGSNVKIIR